MVLGVYLMLYSQVGCRDRWWGGSCGGGFVFLGVCFFFCGVAGVGGWIWRWQVFVDQWDMLELHTFGITTICVNVPVCTIRGAGQVNCGVGGLIWTQVRCAGHLEG